MTTGKKVPEGRLNRFARLAGLGARTGAGLLLSRGGEAAAERAAEQVVEVLGTLRGLAAKVGQMASYVDGILPEGQREAFEGALRSLRAAAPTSPPEAIRAVVEEDLGAPLGELFAAWDDAPFASASIGQVHRAALADGREVAVKVQHPGIDRALAADLENAGMIQAAVGAVAPKALDAKRVFAEVKARFLEELDYGLEAERQRRFAALHRGDPGIRIPEVIGARSSRRVLTTALARGATLEEAGARDEHTRRVYAETLWRFVFKGNLVGGMFNADPHPGNYLFHLDGAVTFLDFGCVEPIDGARLEHARAMHVAALRRDEAAFARSAARILGTRGGRFEELALAYSRRCFEPLFGSPLRVTRDYVLSLAEGVKAMKQQILVKDSGFVQLPPGMVFMNRLQFGFYSVLARLDVEVDYAAVEAAFLRDAGLLE
ncbi:ABC1 kinase family protein [Sorangium sp. So ce131]|uniref:ABC1 kinase family protein n=1 Tax=Sorangium sp. So ce131 TaxID=3133282 RepID=UPI003F5FF87B